MLDLLSRPRRGALYLAAAIMAAACAPAPPPAPAPEPEPAPAEAPPTLPDTVIVDPEAPADTGLITPEELEALRPEPEPEPPPPPPAAARTAGLEHLPPPSATPRMPASRPTGPIMPNHRIVAFYGHPASRRMGILGEVPPDDMLARLDTEVAAWERVDPNTPVIPALHLIATVAAADPGRDGLYRNRTSTRIIDNVMEWADRRNAIVFLDIQPGFSTYEAEMERLMPYLRQPHVHLGIDPEFDMPEGHRPGTRIGTTDAREINRIIGVLSRIVQENNLPPKVLIVHRFTQRMVTNANQIRPTPQVQVVMHMDGWGPPAQKRATYRMVAQEPVQFLGFKVFYRNDRRNNNRIMTPEEILQLEPTPMYIHYH
jgi:hypothetical protein